MIARKSSTAMRKDNLPSFSNPPLIETILGVQFDEIPNLTSAHFGWYWREFLDNAWVRTQETPALTDQFETFGESSRRFPFPHISAKILTSIPLTRMQFINDKDDRVIQIQNTRFLYNWRKRESVYPRFHDLYPEFEAHLSRFREFLAAASLEDIAPNQWEVTYINHIERGELWETPEDWHRILPGLIPPPRSMPGTKLEREAGEISFQVLPERGRLHVQISSGRSNDDGSELLALHLTARGPVTRDDPTFSLQAGIELGHRVLVEAFASIASDSALKFWGKRNS
jgi:uncharacterized protein (TIGR04255 family)